MSSVLKKSLYRGFVQFCVQQGISNRDLLSLRILYDFLIREREKREKDWNQNWRHGDWGKIAESERLAMFRSFFFPRQINYPTSGKEIVCLYLINLFSCCWFISSDKLLRIAMKTVTKRNWAKVTCSKRAKCDFYRNGWKNTDLYLNWYQTHYQKKFKKIIQSLKICVQISLRI